MKDILFSIIIPTRNSSRFLDISVASIIAQKGVRSEVIVTDNNSTDNTRTIAKKMGARVVLVSGSAPQVCTQRNMGAKFAKGKYIIFLDHDMELPKGFLLSLSRQVSKTPEIDAWYIPEQMKASSRLLSAMRTFENSCYEFTPIVAARVIKKTSFEKTNGYDLALSGGPADWDFDLSMHTKGFNFGTSKMFLRHHEETLSYWDYVKKKLQYKRGIEIYKNKWRNKDYGAYRKYIGKQFSPVYRLFTVFFENGKWTRTLRNIHLYIFFIITRTIMLWYYR